MKKKVKAVKSAEEEKTVLPLGFRKISLPDGTVLLGHKVRDIEGMEKILSKNPDLYLARHVKSNGSTDLYVVKQGKALLLNGDVQTRLKSLSEFIEIE